MAYLPPLPNTGVVLADPATVQAFQTTNVNSNFTLIDNHVGTLTASTTNHESRIDILELGTTVAVGTDVNTLKTTGLYKGSNWVNAPVNTIAVLVVEAYSTDWVKQTFTTLGVGAAQRTFTRSFYSATTWSPWREAGNSELASLIQTAGSVAVPTAMTAITGFSAAIVASGAKIRVKFTANYINANSGGDRTVTFQLMNDGVAVTPAIWQFLIPSLASSSVSTTCAAVWEFTPTAGSHTLSFQHNASAAAAVQFADGSFASIEEVS